MNEQPSRFSQAQILIAALFAVVLTGEMPKGGPISCCPSQRLPSLTDAELLLFGKGKKYHGAFTTVAKKLGISSNTVVTVAKGRGQSRRIIPALREEMARIDEKIAPVLVPISTEEREAFQRGGRYWGLMKKVARMRRVSTSTISMASQSPHNYTDSFLALRTEMARVDAEIAAKAVAR
jgi:hypothetical protein